MSPLFYLLFIILFIAIMFAVFKRPMYEILFLAFIIVAVVSGNLANLPAYIKTTASKSLLYAISGFIAFSVILNKTGVMDDFIDILLALVGRFPGGAGYVSILSSTVMGSLSGSAPGNAASIGSITVPFMINTGFNRNLAAVVCAASSSLGPMVPPSGAIITVFGFLVALYPDCCTLSQFWIVCWGVSLWLVLQRIVTLFVYTKVYHIGAVPAENRPSVKAALKKGWKTLLLPVIILLPFLLDSKFSGIFVSRLGEAGAKSLSGALLAIVPSIGAAYCLLISKNKSEYKNGKLFLILREAINQVAPCGVLIFAGFAFEKVFADIGINVAIQQLAESIDISLYVFVILIPLIWIILGMFFEPLTILIMVGQPIIALAASVGINPILMAAASLAIGHVMANMTPPFASTFFVSLGIAKADLVGSTKIMAVWCLLQFVVMVVMLLGLLPIMGLPAFVA